MQPNIFKAFHNPVILFHIFASDPVRVISLLVQWKTHLFGLFTLEWFPLCQVWKVGGGVKKEVPTEDVGKFYDSSCYIVLYTYQGEERKEEYLLCNWIGRHSPLVRADPQYQFSIFRPMMMN